MPSSSERAPFDKFLVNFALAGILTALLVVPWLLPYPEVSQAFSIERTPAEYYSYSAHFGDFVVANNTNWLMVTPQPLFTSYDTLTSDVK